jgi:predicted alpha/beta hydrolase family esterase
MSVVYLTVPGVTNSGPQHWQTHWEKKFPEKFFRIQQENWDTPVCQDWTDQIELEVQMRKPENVVLVAHSLGCTAVVWWAKEYASTAAEIKGAFLVGPSDCEAPTYTFDTKDFAPIPLEKLPFRSLVVASTNDQWVPFERAQFFADSWGSELVNVGDQGHINADSGHGEWPEGLELLKRLD